MVTVCFDSATQLFVGGCDRVSPSMTGESLANPPSLSLPLVDFDSFLKVLNRPGGFREPGEPEEYCRGFQVFDKDMTGFIGVGQLRYSMFCPGQFGCARNGGC